MAGAIVHCRKPVVAAVHGWVVGAGLGVFVTGGLCATLPAAAGLMRAKALMLLGEEFSADQALAWGLVASVVES